MQERKHAVGFATTRWSLVDRLRGRNEAEQNQAAAELAQRYWQPVYFFLRCRGMNIDSAADTTQAFFADVVVGRNLFESAERAKGKLRSLVLASLDRYVIDRERHNARRKRRGRIVSLSALDVSREEVLFASEEGRGTDPPESAFERRWLLAQVEEAVRRCRERFVESGKARNWEAFEARILAPCARTTDPESCEDVAKRLGFASAADVAAAVQYVKKRLLLALKEVLSETEGAEQDTESELRRALTVLG